MSTGLFAKIDEALLEVPEVQERLRQVRHRFPDDEEGTDEFLKLVPFLQYNVPYGELLTLSEEGILARKSREYDPVDDKHLQPEEEIDLFYRFVQHHEVSFQEGYSFVFYGANGSGKTMLALFMLCGFIERGYSGYYIHFKDYMRTFNDATFGDGDMRFLNYLNRCSLLVLDELGKESKASDNVLGELEHLLKVRSANRLPTILCTNARFGTKTHSFKERYGASVYDILLEKYRIFQFESEGNFRAKTRKEWQI